MKNVIVWNVPLDMWQIKVNTCVRLIFVWRWEKESGNIISIDLCLHPKKISGWKLFIINTNLSTAKVAKMTQLVVEAGCSFTSKDQLEAIAINSTKSLGYKSLKEKQLEAMVSLMQGNHTYVCSIAYWLPKLVDNMLF